MLWCGSRLGRKLRYKKKVFVLSLASILSSSFDSLSISRLPMDMCMDMLRENDGNRNNINLINLTWFIFNVFSIRKDSFLLLFYILLLHSSARNFPFLHFFFAWIFASFPYISISFLPIHLLFALTLHDGWEEERGRERMIANIYDDRWWMEEIKFAISMLNAAVEESQRF